MKGKREQQGGKEMSATARAISMNVGKMKQASAAGISAPSSVPAGGESVHDLSERKSATDLAADVQKRINDSGSGSELDVTTGTEDVGPTIDRYLERTAKRREKMRAPTSAPPKDPETLMKEGLK
jgi:hypothetical protein